MNGTSRPLVKPKNCRVVSRGKFPVNPVKMCDNSAPEHHPEGGSELQQLLHPDNNTLAEDAGGRDGVQRVWPLPETS